MNRAGYCFGIDLGTSNSSICFVNPVGRHPLPYVHVEPVMIPKAEFDDSSPRLPSLLFSTGTIIKSGFEALSRWRHGRLWESIFPSAKSDLGAHRFYEDATNQQLDTPVKAQAEILRRLVRAAKERTGEDPCKSKVVITVPASFEMGQRKDTLAAAKLAGLNLGDGDLMDEPNAAFLDLVNSQAIDRLDLSTPNNVLVFDFGGGTCDVSVLRVKKERDNRPLGLLIENLAISNYARLGGDNIDLLLVNEKLLPAICRNNGIKLEALTERDKRELRWYLKEVGCRLKERLCKGARVERANERHAMQYEDTKQVCTIDPFHLTDAGLTTRHTKVEITFSEFEAVLEPFFSDPTDDRIKMTDGYYAESVFAPVLEALDRARLSPEAVDVVLLNGGSCRNPLLVRAFKQLDILSGAEILDKGDLDLAVARGAAVRCFYKHHQKYDPIIPIVNAEVGLITHGDNYETLVNGGTPLPYPGEGQFQQYKDRFWIPKDGIPKLHFPVYSGSEGNRCLVQTMALDMPPSVRRGDSVIVELNIDSNKLMRFRAFLASHPSALLEVKLENPLAIRAPSPSQRAALAHRRRLHQKRLQNAHYCPSLSELASLANLERLAGEPERGLDILQRLQSKLKKANQPLPADTHNLLGLCYNDLRDSEHALHYYKLATDADPDNDTYARNYGHKLAQMGRPEAAIPHLRRAISLDPEEGDYFVLLGDALRQLGHEAEAVREFQRGKKVLEEQLRQSPSDDFLLRWAAGVCRRLGENEEADKYNSRRLKAARTERLGAPLDELVAGLDSGIIPPDKLRDDPAS
jgi:molecular chaperone DnaK (HSP70)/Flp pilus assembly protein TadD